VKVTIMFRGREVFHPELGKKILDQVAEEVNGTARVESEARLDGRNMVMVLAPDKRARQSAAARAAHDEEAGGTPAVGVSGEAQGGPDEGASSDGLDASGRDGGAGEGGA
jgi:translation initiation factor IF-3